jgi:insertion element IS1 protein InsB
VGAGAAQKKAGDLIVECDEMWSFVGTKQDPWWVWAALDADTRQVVAMVVGDRSGSTAQCLWDALPDEYRDGAVVCTDAWSAYRSVVPAERHAVGGKGDGITNHIERFWCTVRQRCGRFVRKTLEVPQVRREPHRLPLVLHPTIQPITRIGPLPPGVWN